MIKLSARLTAVFDAFLSPPGAHTLTLSLEGSDQSVMYDRR